MNPERGGWASQTNIIVTFPKVGFRVPQGQLADWESLDHMINWYQYWTGMQQVSMNCVMQHASSDVNGHC